MVKDQGQKSVNELQKAIRDFQTLRFPKKHRQSFMEIMKLGFNENVSTRTLAFFLDTTEEHDLDDLVLQALLRGVDPKYHGLDHQMNTQKVLTEKSTAKGRIDLWVETSEYIVVIENKMLHHTNNNPFDDYIAHANEHNKDKKELIFVLLGIKKPKSMPSGFQFVSHFELSKFILKDLGRKTLQADAYYLTYLIDYLALIEQNNPSSEYGKMQMDIVNFYRNNHEILEQIESEDSKKSVYQYYYKELKDIIQALENKGIKIFSEDAEFGSFDTSVANIGRGVTSIDCEIGHQKISFDLAKSTSGTWFWLDCCGKNEVKNMKIVLREENIKIVEQNDYPKSIQLLKEPENITAEEFVDIVAPIIQKIMNLKVSA